MKVRSSDLMLAAVVGCLAATATVAATAGPRRLAGRPASPAQLEAVLGGCLNPVTSDCPPNNFCGNRKCIPSPTGAGIVCEQGDNHNKTKDDYISGVTTDPNGYPSARPDQTQCGSTRPCKAFCELVGRDFVCHVDPQGAVTPYMVNSQRMDGDPEGCGGGPIILTFRGRAVTGPAS